jgi:pimeloyl-ACP methyl ester carboxylesterase
MTAHSHETAPRQFIKADGIRFAYRRFGGGGSIPLVFLQYFSANMDAWDPAVTNGFAADREVILFNNAGVASSGGETPASVLEMTQHCVAFLDALGLEEIDVVGFSLGGMIAQQLALDHPKLVRRVILLGTGPRGGEGLTFTELSPVEQENPESLLLGALFSPTNTSQAAGKALIQRLKVRKEHRDPPVSRQSAEAQLKAIREWGMIPSSDRYSNLANIKHQILIVHGNHDIVVSPINALILTQRLPNAQLIIYPDSGHAAQYQHADLFLKHATMFLNAEGR